MSMEVNHPSVANQNSPQTSQPDTSANADMEAMRLEHERLTGQGRVADDSISAENESTPAPQPEAQPESQPAPKQDDSRFRKEGEEAGESLQLTDQKQDPESYFKTRFKGDPIKATENYLETRQALTKAQTELSELRQQAESHSSVGVFNNIMDTLNGSGGKFNDELRSQMVEQGWDSHDLMALEEFYQSRVEKFESTIQGSVETDYKILLDWAGKNYNNTTLAAYQSMIHAGQAAAVLPIIEKDYLERTQQQQPQMKQGEGTKRTGAGYKSVDELKAAMTSGEYQFNVEKMKEHQIKFSNTDPAVIKEWERLNGLI